MCHYLVAHVDLGEAEGAEVRVGALHRRLDGFSEQLVHELADERPHLFHRLRKERKKKIKETELEKYSKFKFHTDMFQTSFYLCLVKLLADSHWRGLALLLSGEFLIYFLFLFVRYKHV